MVDKLLFKTWARLVVCGVLLISGWSLSHAILPKGEAVFMNQPTLNAGEVSVPVSDTPFSFQLVIRLDELPAGGVILSVGDDKEGFALWLDRNQPVFTICRRGQRTEVRGEEFPMVGQYRIGARVGVDGTVTFLQTDFPVESVAGGGWLRGVDGQVHFRTDPGGVIGRPEVSNSPYEGAVRQGFLYTGKQSFLDSREVFGDLKSIFYEQGKVDLPWPEFPRPEFVRQYGQDGPAWQNLNGWWDYSIVPAGSETPARWDGEIRVPFVPESQLSGVSRYVGPENEIWYHRNIDIKHMPRDGERVVLNFEAVDWRATVWVNGIEVGMHEGGYDPFSFDITDALHSRGPQQIIVRAWDPIDAGHNPRGKQTLMPIGIWYTAMTGIWQTVWLETVPKARLSGLAAPHADLSRGELTIIPRVTNVQKGHMVRAKLQRDGRTVAEVTGLPGKPLVFRKSSPRLWSLDDPYLYDLQLELLFQDRVVDTVKSYTAWRTIEWKPAEDGYVRAHLNGEPVFLYGTLDQGWWPDGLLTAPSDEALKFDIERTLAMGFNTIRKHITIEPARWYYHADKLGILVWQDMPSGFAGTAQGPGHITFDAEDDWDRPLESRQSFEREYAAMVENLAPFPSIIIWGVFNEGWGQYETARVSAWARNLDLSRTTHPVSGWTDRGIGPLYDVHVYPMPGMDRAETVPGRAVVLSEFGGLGHAVPGHLWQERGNWGYQNIADREEFIAAYTGMVETLIAMKQRGLASAIYTQTTDVEGEINGLLTYDRAIEKIDAGYLNTLHQRLYEETPTVIPLLADADDEPNRWQYRFDPPGTGWRVGRDGNAGWQWGSGAFGNSSQRGHDPRTEWDENRIWLRNTFRTERPTDILLVRYKMHVADAALFINGQKVADLGPPHRLNRQYFETLIELPRTLPVGEHNIAVEARQPRLEKFIDLGIKSVHP